jgi:hypothetical protein
MQAHWSRGTYRLAAVEYDDTFFHVGPVARAEVLQRELVSVALARLGLRCWTPVGEVVGVHGDVCQVHFGPAGHSPSVRHPRPGDVLQLCRHVWLPEGVKPTTSRQQYLLVDKVDGTDSQSVSAEAKVARPPGSASLFSHFGQPRVRYLARCLHARSGPATVEVRLRESGQPREGCEVYVSLQPPDSSQPPGQLQGITDSRGRVSISPPNATLFHVTVRYDDMIDTKVCVPGAGDDPLVFLMPDRGERTAFRLQLARVRQEVELRRYRLKHMAEELQEAGRSLNAARASQLYSEAREQFNLEDLKQRLERTRILTRSSGVDVEAEIQTLSREIDNLERDESKAKFAERAHKTKIADVKNRMQAAMGTKDWAQAGRLMEELCQIDPENEEARKMRDRYRRVSLAANPHHEAARRTVKRLDRTSHVDGLLVVWNDLRQALDVLLENQDRLALDTASLQYDTWYQLIKNELIRIQQISSSPVPEQEKAVLDQRVADLKRVFEELVDIQEQTERLLAGGVLPTGS